MRVDGDGELIDASFVARHRDLRHRLKRRLSGGVRHGRGERDYRKWVEERHWRYPSGFQVCSSSLPSLHHVYKASDTTLPCSIILWPSFQFLASPSETVATPAASAARSLRAVSAARTIRDN